VDGVLAEPAPLFLFDPACCPAHLQCKLVLQIADRGTLGRVQSELRLRLLARFAPRACRSRRFFHFPVDLSIAA